jgi:hypothetical protein
MPRENLHSGKNFIPGKPSLRKNIHSGKTFVARNTFSALLTFETEIPDTNPT